MLKTISNRFTIASTVNDKAEGTSRLRDHKDDGVDEGMGKAGGRDGAEEQLGPGRVGSGPDVNQLDNHKG